MSANKEKLSVAEVTVGMYVCDLDRPWLDTPFLMQGFLVDDHADLKTLAEYCQYVYVDRYRSREDAVFPDHHANVAAFPCKPSRHKRPEPVSRKQNERQRKVLKLLEGREQFAYRDTITWHNEFAAARRAIAQLNVEVSRLFESLHQGSAYSFAKLKQSIAPLVASIERNPDACMWLARLGSRDSDLYRHAVATAIWALALGRELGLSPRDMKTLALGALLLDIGLLHTKFVEPGGPVHPAGSPRRASAAESAGLRSHVELGLATLDGSPLNKPEIRDMIAGHHEHYDGTGYPQALKGESISLLARIATIADSYDAMTSKRPCGQGLSPSFAIRQLYRSRGSVYDGVLVEEFIQAVGLYPAGTLVLLSSGEVAMVVAEGRSRRLKPQVLLVLDGQKHPYMTLRLLNLISATCPETGAPLEIIQSLEPGSYGVDPASVAFDQVLGA
ncbi:DUF3391 domain-containing protein [Proteobacteria bacterium 005FR1]|nr:DUF3391 domain-containing protein [Proteobacteria bacterium 005FR1]